MSRAQHFPSLHRSGQFRLLAGLAVLLCLLVMVSQQGHAAVRFTEATGRAIIQPGADPSEARMMALEDALYLAALQGGAKINGFSSIASDTSLTDQIVVRPASNIMDYAVINEVIDGEHFSVTIRAAVGDASSPKCQRPRINVTAFKPVFKIDPKAPAWAVAYRQALVKDMITLLEDNEKLSLTNATDRRFSKSALAGSNDAFDYTALTSGKISVGAGDFALVPEIRIDQQRIASGLIRREAITVTLVMHGYHGHSYAPAFSESASTAIEVKRRSPLALVDVLTKKSRHELTEAMRGTIPASIEAAISTMACQPLKASLQSAEKALSVPFGRRHGVTQTSLAVTNEADAGWTVFKVAKLTNNEATLVPLDPTRDMATLVGKTVEFMELSQ